MKKWNPFLQPAAKPAYLAPIPGAEWSTLNHLDVDLYPQPMLSGNNWPGQLIPAPYEGFVLAHYHQHVQTLVQAGWTDHDAVLVSIDRKQVGDI